MKKRTKWASGSLTVLVVGIIALRLYLPTLALDYVNRELGTLPEYRGHVDDIRIRLWRGAYQIRGLRLEKLHGNVPVPFVSAALMDLAVQWKALLHRSIVGNVEIYRPKLNFVTAPTPEGSQTKIDKKQSTRVAGQLMPIRINRLAIHDGEIHFLNFQTRPKVDVYLTDVSAVATNLSDVQKEGEALPAHVDASAKVYGGTLRLRIDLDPLAKSPTFELKETLDGVHIEQLNDFLDAYAKIKAKSGEFSLYMEIAAKNGSFTGYAKPFIRHLKIDKRKGSEKPLKEAWAYVAAAVGKVFTNPKKKQIATKIPIQGRFEQADVDVWAAIGNLLRNAFVQALAPTLDQTIRLGNVKASSRAHP